MVLRGILLLSLSGFLGSFVLLGHIASTLAPMYALAMLAVTGYVMARGPRHTLTSFLEYLCSWTMAPRWLFLALAALSLLWTARPAGLAEGSSLTRVLTLLLIQTSAWVVYDATRRLGEFENVLRIIFYSSALGASIALLDLDAVGGYRIRGMFGNPNVLAITGTLGLLTFIGYLCTSMARWERVLAVIPVIALQAAVFSSGSRKGLLGLVIVWLTGLVQRRTRGMTMMVIGLALTASLAAFALAPKLLQDAAFRNLNRLATTFEQSTTSATIDFSAAERARFIEEGLALMAEAPIFGHGLDTFRSLSGEGSYAHNNYIELGVGLGLVGVLVFYTFPLVLIYLLSRLRWRGTSDAGQLAAFGLATLGLILVMDVGAVTYMSKLVSIVPIIIAGAIDARTNADRPRWRA